MILPLFFVLLMSVTMGAVLWSTTRTSAQKSASARLSEIAQRPVLGVTDHQISLSSKDSSGLGDQINGFLEERRFGVFVQRLILHAGSETTVDRVVLIGFVSALVCGFLGYKMIGVLSLAILLAALGAMLPLLFLNTKKNSRLKKFDEALPDAIELMSRALRAGHSLTSSIEMIAQQSSEPLASEFEGCFQQQKFGIPFRETMLSMGDRIPSDDLHFFMTAILVQKETGGDLVEVLDRTARLIRDRFRIRGEIRTHTAQGRLTGWILALMPVGMLLLMNVISPGYSDLLFHHWLGQRLLMAGGVLIVTGGLIIRRIVDIKV